MPIWKALASNIYIDLTAPDLSAINIWRDIALPLARLCRFDGQAGGDTGLDARLGYSVAQHSVVGADVALAETGDLTLARAFLVHDAHEPVGPGDISTPSVKALDALIRAELQTYSRHEWTIQQDWASKAVAEFKRKVDVEIHRLALLRPDETTCTYVAALDTRMLAAERHTFFAATPDDIWPSGFAVMKPINPAALAPWPVSIAAGRWMARWIGWHPANAGKVSDGPYTPEEVLEVWKGGFAPHYAIPADETQESEVTAASAKPLSFNTVDARRSSGFPDHIDRDGNGHYVTAEEPGQ